MSEITDEDVEMKAGAFSHAFKKMINIAEQFPRNYYILPIITVISVIMSVVFGILYLRAKNEEARAKDGEARAKDREARAKDEEARAKDREAHTRTEFNIYEYMTEGSIPQNFLEFTIDFPRVELSENIISQATRFIRDFNEHRRTIEKSASIDNPISSHFLWRQLIQLILSNADEIRDSIRVTMSNTNKPFESRRALYEWVIIHPFSGVPQYIDYTFTPSQTSYLNWYNYSGGLEIKKSNQGLSGIGKSSSSGLLNSKGRSQALSRAAMCVYARWKHANETGAHSAFCCFADGRSFAVARTQVKSDQSFIAESSKLITLPGVDGSSCPRAIEIFAYLLLAPMSELSEYISPPILEPFEVRGLLNSGLEDCWPLNECLGCGSFATVYSFQPLSDSHYENTVIKTVGFEGENCSKLMNESSILNALSQNGVSAIPSVIDAMRSVKVPNNVIALKLSPRGIPLDLYISGIGFNRQLVSHLIRLLGPAIITTLQAAHNVNIAHCDVRMRNILIIPPNGYMAKFAVRRDIDEEIKLIQSIQLDFCDFILNDWGEAVVVNNRNKHKRFVDDLISFTEFISRFYHVTDSSYIGRKSEFPVFKLISKGKMFPIFKKKVYDRLSEFAEIRGYDDMIKQLQKKIYFYT